MTRDGNRLNFRFTKLIFLTVIQPHYGIKRVPGKISY